MHRLFEVHCTCWEALAKSGWEAEEGQGGEAITRRTAVAWWPRKGSEKRG
jgi:hypothetical protein